MNVDCNLFMQLLSQSHAPASRFAPPPHTTPWYWKRAQKYASIKVNLLCKCCCSAYCCSCCCCCAVSYEHVLYLFWWQIFHATWQPISWPEPRQCLSGIISSGQKELGVRFGHGLGIVDKLQSIISHVQRLSQAERLEWVEWQMSCSCPRFSPLTFSSPSRYLAVTIRKLHC